MEYVKDIDLDELHDDIEGELEILIDQIRDNYYYQVDIRKMWRLIYEIAEVNKEVK